MLFGHSLSLYISPLVSLSLRFSSVSSQLSKFHCTSVSAHVLVSPPNHVSVSLSRVFLCPSLIGRAYITHSGHMSLDHFHLIVQRWGSLCRSSIGLSLLRLEMVSATGCPKTSKVWEVRVVEPQTLQNSSPPSTGFLLPTAPCCVVPCPAGELFSTFHLLTVSPLFCEQENE